MADWRLIRNILIGARGGDLRISATRISSASAAARASGGNGTALAGGGCGGRGVAVGVGTRVGVGGGKDGVEASATTVDPDGVWASSEPLHPESTTPRASTAIRSHLNLMRPLSPLPREG